MAASDGRVDRAVADVELFDPRVYKRGVPYEDFAHLRATVPVAWHPEPESTAV